MRSFRFFLAPVIAVLLLTGAGPARGEEIWTVRSGVTSIYFNRDLMRDLDLDLVSVEETAPFPEEMEFRMEEPHFSFSVSGNSDFSFKVDRGVAVPYGVIGGRIVHRGNAVLSDLAGGQRQSLEGLQIGYLPGVVDGPGGPHPTDTLVLTDPRTGRVVFDLDHCMFDYRRDTGRLWIHYGNMRIDPDWAASFGRPDLANWTIAMAEVLAEVERTGGSASTEAPYVPEFGDSVDVSLGGLNQIAQVAHDGTYPGGTAALSMATTACNLGLTDVPWLAPMQVNHPVIAMALYRLLDGRFEQIGVSWLKHGFYALSNDDCSVCRHPSDGTFLGVGCSDTYGVINNQDRNYLGPRSEVDPFTAVWTCLGSHFAGGQPDCVRRHTGSGHGPLDHRLNALDSDLDLPGAAYFYEADYLVRGDADLENNIGSRVCTMSWNGSVWQFSTPSSDNPLVNGPAINRWGDLRTTGGVDSTDGYFTLAVAVSDAGGGLYHYEYALFNRNSALGAHSFSVPVGDAVISNLGFHDSDYDAADDWAATLDGGVLTWATDDFETNPQANALGYDLLYNFRFDADAPPGDVDAEVALFRPHVPGTLALATRGPNAASSVRPSAPAARVLLQSVRPNPLAAETSVLYSLAAAGPVRLEIYDAQARLIRILVDSRLPAGTHQTTWDGTDDRGRPAAAGVYSCRVRAGGQTDSRAVVMLR